jgi:hypothetical protein
MYKSPNHQITSCELLVNLLAIHQLITSLIIKSKFNNQTNTQVGSKIVTNKSFRLFETMTKKRKEKKEI